MPGDFYFSTSYSFIWEAAEFNDFFFLLLSFFEMSEAAPSRETMKVCNYYKQDSDVYLMNEVKNTQLLKFPILFKKDKNINFSWWYSEPWYFSFYISLIFVQRKLVLNDER